mmetsp:Transcript_9461/g.27957  ORF Transcript_9461/g.27957 Transcript_9461/m.27957 type:complete len:279 (+) Transcript_9461:772-1608(+)
MARVVARQRGQQALAEVRHLAQGGAAAAAPARRAAARGDAPLHVGGDERLDVRPWAAHHLLREPLLLRKGLRDAGEEGAARHVARLGASRHAGDQRDGVGHRGGVDGRGADLLVDPRPQGDRRGHQRDPAGRDQPQTRRHDAGDGAQFQGARGRAPSAQHERRPEDVARPALPADGGRLARVSPEGGAVERLFSQRCHRRAGAGDRLSLPDCARLRAPREEDTPGRRHGGHLTPRPARRLRRVLLHDGQIHRLAHVFHLRQGRHRALHHQAREPQALP